MRKRLGDLQDGLLAHYQEQARASDVNVEARLEKEPFDVMKIIGKKRIITAARYASGASDTRLVRRASEGSIDRLRRL